MATIKPVGKRETLEWTATLIRMLRGKRTQQEFGQLLGVPKNTVWRWEASQVKPHEENEKRLLKLAQQEQFLQDWRLKGSMTLVGDVDAGLRTVSTQFKKSIERSKRDLRG